LNIVIGVVLALALGILATRIGFDRERSFYPTMMIVIASYYVLFAVISGSAAALGAEVVLLSLFSAAAVAGFKKTQWLVVAALASHGLLDSVHHELITNPGVPWWWPGFCLAFDVTIAGYLAYRLLRAA
jgi:hypothetical protein